MTPTARPGEGDAAALFVDVLDFDVDDVADPEDGAKGELAAVEQAQIAVLEEFLPPAVDPEEIRAAVRAAIAGGAKDLGKVMGQVLPKYKGRVDGKVVNQIVREELQAG